MNRVFQMGCPAPVGLAVAQWKRKVLAPAVGLESPLAIWPAEN